MRLVLRPVDELVQHRRLLLERAGHLGRTRRRVVLCGGGRGVSVWLR